MVLWFVCVHMSGEADACLLSICYVPAVLVTQQGVGKVISAFMSFTVRELHIKADGSWWGGGRGGAEALGEGSPEGRIPEPHLTCISKRAEC